MYIFSFTWPSEASPAMPESKDVTQGVKDIIEERELVSILEWVLSNQNISL